MIGTLTMNHMTITKMYTLEHEDILEVDKSVDLVISLPNESAIKRTLRIGICLIARIDGRKFM